MRTLIELVLAHRHSREAWAPQKAHLGRDRRIFLRIAMQMPCRINSRLYGLESEAATVNMSLGGMGFTAPVNWPEGSPVRVHLDTCELALDGLIVFRQDASPRPRYGVKFERLGFRDLLKLRRVLKANHKGPLAVL